MTTYRVLKIAESIEKAEAVAEVYKDVYKDTKEFPEFCKYVEDEVDIFIYNEETKTLDVASEFFFIHSISSFTVNS